MEDSVNKIIAPGIEVSTVYYDDLNSHKSSEDIIYDNRFVQQLNSLTIGAQGVQIIIPNEKIVDECILALQFTGFGDTVTNKLGLVPVPAYAVIDAIEWAIAGSTVYRESGLQHMINVLADCETLEKRDELIRLAGGNGSGAFTASTTYYAHLNLPWSKINNVGLNKFGIDSRLVSQPLRILLYFKQPTAVYYNNGGTVTIPTSFGNAFVQARQGEFKDTRHHLNLRPMVVQADGRVVQEQKYYFYPFQFNQSYNSQIFQGSIAPSTPAQIPLTAFRKGNLEQIRISLYNLNPSGVSSNSVLANPATSSTNYVASSDPYSLQLFFNGIQIYRSDADSFKMLSLENDITVPWARTQVPGTSYYWVDIPFSRLLSKEAREMWEQGYDFSNQTLQLQLNTPTTDNYQVVATYIYHAHIMFDGVSAEVQF